MNTNTKVLLITGASKGIGAATARRAAQDGWSVAVHYHQDAFSAAEVCSRIMMNGGQAHPFSADLRDEYAIDQLFRDVLSHFGQLNGLVNNVGITPVFGRVDDMNAQRLNEVFSTNVTAAFLCAGQAVKAMSTRYGHAGGVIVNISSRAAILGSGHRYVDYAASKAALDALTVGLAKEVAEEGIRVNGVRPGIIRTSIHDKNGGDAMLQIGQASIPMQRIGEPEEVAESVVWLLSNASSYMTGSFLDVSGGR
ncbi:SDR family oxidoreductase [Hydromonas duriensis]|uniref:NAD(P)-dependent dehydrogenase (Short-subunit alcohol dehydrogenase family) n=1 Tax=Hydromonas duriensis TaxID=1527608 RepID=A0A4R6Y9A0_9BURK|nr:SDR family oxidoreductase [Hydromonas duriensis]TDR32008.1 NAD(P)-dependent dehydrogenase (short-subunit alcohol dehydrogenase family) [Hydromonas duriensis]